MTSAATSAERPPSTDEAAVLRRLENQGPAMLDQVLAWSAINTGSRNLEGLERMAEVLQAAFSPLGEATLRPAGLVESVDAAGTAQPQAHGANLHLSVRPDAALRVVLTGHMDTVYPSDHPFQACRWLDADTLNGPGVADMKGGIAVMLAALQAFEASPYAAALGFEVVINSDEEISSPGSAPLLAEVAGRCRLGLTYEPSFKPDGTLAGARKGSGNFSLVIHGRSAHAGRNPEDGRNAVVAAADAALRLAALSGARAGLSVNVARVDGGGPNNVVPDLAVLRFNARVAEHEDQAFVEAAVARISGEVQVAHDVHVHRHGGFSRPPKPLDDHQLSLFTLVRACGRSLGTQISWASSGGVCDGNNLAAAGLAVVDTLGVRGGAIHSPEEYLIAPSLVERARLSALILMRIAQGDWR